MNRQITKALLDTIDRRLDRDKKQADLSDGRLEKALEERMVRAHRLGQTEATHRAAKAINTLVQAWADKADGIADSPLSVRYTAAVLRDCAAELDDLAVGLMMEES